MLLRKALMAALVVAPFVVSPSLGAAQTGLDRAAVATAQADAVGAGQNSQAPSDLPPGISKRFSGQTLPPGIRRTRDAGAAPQNDGTDDSSEETLVCLLYETVFEGFTVKQVCVLWGTP